VKTGDVSLAFEGSKKNPMYTAAFSGDGRWLAAVGDDRRLRVWRTNDLHLASEEKVSPKALYAAAFFPDQQQVAVAGENGIIYLIAMDSGR
jgi:WD40 repeat protein